MQRDRRSNAGNRMSKLLDEEEECQDDFYKINYGGFQETETDNEYEYVFTITLLMFLYFAYYKQFNDMFVDILGLRKKVKT